MGFITNTYLLERVNKEMRYLFVEVASQSVLIYPRSRADVGVSPGGPLLWFIEYFSITCSYEIQSFAKFKHPEYTRLQNQNHWKRLRIAEYILSQSLTVCIGETTPSYFQHF